MKTTRASYATSLMLLVVSQAAFADQLMVGQPAPNWLPPPPKPECLQIAIARLHSFRGNAEGWLSKPQTATAAELIRERVASELRARTFELFPVERSAEERHRVIAAVSKAAMSAADSMSVVNSEMRAHSYYEGCPDSGWFGTFLLGEISHADLLAAIQKAYLLPAVRDAVKKQRFDDVMAGTVSAMDIAIWSSAYFEGPLSHIRIEWGPPPAMPAVTGFITASKANTPVSIDMKSADWLPINEREAISLYRVGPGGIARETTLDVGGICRGRLSFTPHADGLALWCECWKGRKKSCDWTALHLFHETGDQLVRGVSISPAELPKHARMRPVELDGQRFILTSDWFEYLKQEQPNPIHIFKYDRSQWALEQTLTATIRDAEFGTSFAIDGDTIAVGAPGFPSRAPRDQSNNRGRVNVYYRRDHQWSMGRKLMADDSQVGDRFGSTVALEGNILAVGAIMDDTTGAEAGSVYIFQRNESSWSIQAKLTPPDLHSVRHFGRALALDRGVLFVAAETVDLLGSIYEFRLSDGVWNCTRRFGPDGTNVRFIGTPLVIYDDWVVTTGQSYSDRPGVGEVNVLMFPRK